MQLMKLKNAPSGCAPILSFGIEEHLHPMIVVANPRDRVVSEIAGQVRTVLLFVLKTRRTSQC